MTTLPCLTIWQPWASLIMAGAKPYEFRGWAAPRRHRGRRIGIHAGARKVRRDELLDLRLRLSGTEAWSTALRPEIALPLLELWSQQPSLLPLASLLGTAVLGEPRADCAIVAEFGGTVNDSDRDQHMNWAWPLSAIVPLEPILPMKGAQGFWPATLDGIAA